MSDTGEVNKRTRRRAVRSEGPPPEEQNASPVSETTVEAESGKASDTTETVRFDKAPDDAATERIPQPPAVELTKDVPPEPEAPIVESAAPATESAAPATESEAPAAASDGKRFGWELILSAVAAVLAIAVIASTAWVMHLRSEASEQDALRADYVQTAKQAMLNITNISADTAPEDIKRVLEVTSGDLAAEYEQRKDDYAGIVKKAEVKAQGEVVEAAVESADDNTAIVLVAVKQTLTNAGAEGPQQRQFRFRVTVAHTEKGLAATQMEMVI